MVGDGCDDHCQIESGANCNAANTVCSLTCGNGVVVSPETCDDGNLEDGDGCDSSCAVES